jgi:hypothetical protein
MGLDTSHNCWHGAYSAFTRFRTAVAEQAGYDIADVTFKDGYFAKDCVLMDWGHLPDGSTWGNWDKNPSDPLVVLICHSDCEGVIKPEQGRPLSKRLYQIAESMDDDDPSKPWGDFKARTIQFADGLKEAAENGEEVEFR